MTRELPLLRASLAMSAGSLLMQVASVAAGHRVNYLDHLPAFNAMAAAMLALCLAALAGGLLGTWRSRGRNLSFWLADAIAVMILATLLLDG